MMWTKPEWFLAFVISLLVLILLGSAIAYNVTGNRFTRDWEAACAVAGGQLVEAGMERGCYKITYTQISLEPFRP
jgi:hypothetical protein